MKKVLLTMTVLFILFVFPVALWAQERFFDDFEDGDTNGWDFRMGDWWVEDGVLKQVSVGTSYAAFVEDNIYEDQIIETDFRVDCGGCVAGFSIWYQDGLRNKIFLRAALAYNSIIITESISNVNTEYFYPVHVTTEEWHNLRAITDSSNGTIDVYLDDAHLFTHEVTTPHRSGLTGLMSNTRGTVGLFDNFSIMPLPLSDKEQCKDGGWQVFDFKNQGDCVSFCQNNKDQ